MSSDEPSKTSGRRWRGVAVVAGIAFVLVVTTFASALLFREDLAQAVLRDQLNELGLKDSRFRVEQITIGSISIAEFSAGTAVSFDRLTVGFSASEILRGRVARIEVTGLQVDMTQPGPWAELRRKYDGKNDHGAGSPLDLSVLPIINIRQARLRIDGRIRRRGRYAARACRRPSQPTHDTVRRFLSPPPGLLFGQPDLMPGSSVGRRSEPRRPSVSRPAARRSGGAGRPRDVEEGHADN